MLPALARMVRRGAGAARGPVLAAAAAAMAGAVAADAGADSSARTGAGSTASSAPPSAASAAAASGSTTATSFTAPLHSASSPAAPQPLPPPPLLPYAALPTHKLSCKAAAAPPRTPVVLVLCGSFNPPTVMHVRMVELAAAELMRRGYDVWGAYLSPVGDAYVKPGLAPAAERVAMCRLAADPPRPQVPTARTHTTTEHASTPSGGGQAGAGTAVREQQQQQQQRLPPPQLPYRDPEPDLVMVHEWEAAQPGYTRTLTVLRHVEAELAAWLASVPEPGAPTAGTAAAGSPGASTGRERAAPRPVRAMLLCGADVLASMAVPGVWHEPSTLLAQHGAVCVARAGTDAHRVLCDPASPLHAHRDHVVLVQDHVGNSISSSAVRQELAAGRPVRWLLPPGVAAYVYGRGLYGARAGGGAGAAGAGAA